MLKPLLKYPGGKSSEIKEIQNLIPDKIEHYVEPFVGGGALYWRINANKYIINDISQELTLIYTYTKEQDAKFLNYFSHISAIWDNKNMYYIEIEKILKKYVFNSNDYESVDLSFPNTLLQGSYIYMNHIDYFNETLNKVLKRKITSLRKININGNIKNWDENSLGIIGATLYTLNRYLYNSTSIKENPQLKVALYYFLREYSYSSMFRYNKNGEFNVPFGGNSYAKKSLTLRYSQITSFEVISKLNFTDIYTSDFSKVMLQNFTENDFIFLDPPYDSDFSEYNQNSFEANDQIRLANILINETNAKWMMVIKNTEFIYDLYNVPHIYINSFNKNYSVNFKNRNKKSSEHLIITNYI